MAMEAPIPLEAPVTMATLPLSLWVLVEVIFLRAHEDVRRNRSFRTDSGKASKGRRTEIAASFSIERFGVASVHVGRVRITATDPIAGFHGLRQDDRES